MILVIIILAGPPLLGAYFLSMLKRFWQGRGYFAAQCRPLQVDAPVELLLFRSRRALIYERGLVAAWPTAIVGLFCIPVVILLASLDRAYGWRVPLEIMMVFIVAFVLFVTNPLAILDILVGALPQYYSTPPWLREQRLNERRIIVRRLNEDAQKKGSRRRINEDWWIPWWARERDS